MKYMVTVAMILFVAGAAGSEPGAALQLSSEGTIVLSADEAAEDPFEDIFHFKGNFELRTSKWAVLAEQASVYGKLEQPDRILAEGSPAHILFIGAKPDGTEPVEGEALRIEYDRSSGIVSLTGNVKLKSGQRILQSSEIRYDLEHQNIEAGGLEGVQITITPEP